MIMRKISPLTRTVVLAVACVALPAMAGEASVCHSGIQSYSTTGNGGAFPQLSNATRFNCQAGGVAYTIPQLAQRGWRIVQVVPVVYPTTYQNDGTAIMRQRQQLIIEK
jgi:hypothetical protein